MCTSCDLTRNFYSLQVTQKLNLPPWVGASHVLISYLRHVPKVSALVPVHVGHKIGNDKLLMPPPPHEAWCMPHCLSSLAFHTCDMHPEVLGMYMFVHPIECNVNNVAPLTQIWQTSCSIYDH